MSNRFLKVFRVYSIIYGFQADRNRYFISSVKTTALRDDRLNKRKGYGQGDAEKSISAFGG